MAVLRIIANLQAEQPSELARFYSRLLGLDIVMDLGWIVTLAGSGHAPLQLSLAREGGSGTLVPSLSIEVDNLDAVYDRAKGDAVSIEYPLTREPWGVRRFYLRDPAGTLVNILSHDPPMAPS